LLEALGLEWRVMRKATDLRSLVHHLNQEHSSNDKTLMNIMK